MGYLIGKESQELELKVTTSGGHILLKPEGTSGRILIGESDTNLYRYEANQLKTDDSFIVGGNLTVSGSMSAGNGLSVTGDISVTGTVDGVNVSGLPGDISTKLTATNYSASHYVTSFRAQTSGGQTWYIYQFDAYGRITNVYIDS